MKNDLRTRVFLRTERRTYYYVLKTAALALLSAAAAILPFVISGHGVLTLRDDFNYQQLAFSILCGDFIKHGNFGWSWVTDLGSSVIGSYSFYNLASPFALLTAWLPAAAIPYAAAPVLILKYCTAAVLAFLFIKRFVGNPDAAVFGALLYAFCGFQTVNLIFPFHDVTALFPLLLIGLEELVINRRRGVFALSVALSCMLNYYFFFGQIVFLVIYFAFRFIIGEASSLHPAACETKKPETSSRKIIRRLVNAAHCIAEGLLGIGIAGVIFIPSVLSVLQNPRIGSSVSEIIFDWTRYFTILQGYFLPADVMGSQGYFLEKACTSCSLCLPFIAMSFVFAYMLKNKKKPLTLFAVSIIIISCIPILNSMFSMFNSQYYARWFYMAALIFALISSIALSEAAAAEICRAESSDRKKDLFHKKYLIRGSAANLICVVITIFAEAALILIFKITGHPYLEKINIGTAALYAVFALACSGILPIILIKAGTSKRLIAFLTAGVMAASSITTAAALYRYRRGGTETTGYDGITVNTDKPLSSERTLEILTDISVEKLSLPAEQNYRIRTAWNEAGEEYVWHSYDNLSMTTGVPSINSFISTVSGGIFEFYNNLGITRTVTTVNNHDQALTALLSCRYYLTAVEDSTGKAPSGSYKHSDGTTIYVYEYDNFIPIGFSYEYYITPEELAALPEEHRTYALLNALALSSDDAAGLQDIIKPISESSINLKAYSKDAENEQNAALLNTAVKRHNEEASYFFERGDYGFVSKIRTETPKVAYFSIPFDGGWSASVNGKYTTIYRSGGMMALKLEAGDNTIVFTYEAPGLKTGLVMSVLCFTITVLYMSAGPLYRLRKKNKKTVYEQIPL